MPYEALHTGLGIDRFYLMSIGVFIIIEVLIRAFATNRNTYFVYGYVTCQV